MGLELDEWTISFDNMFKRKLGTSDTNHLWKDLWFENTTLKISFPNLYLIEPQQIVKLLIEFKMETLLELGARRENQEKVVEYKVLTDVNNLVANMQVSLEF